MEQSGKFSWSAAAFWDIPYPVTRRIASSLYSTEYFVVCFLRLMPLSPCNLYFVTHLRTNESEIERWSAVPCQIVLNDGKSEFGGFAFEVQLSLTEKGQYAVAYDLSCKKD
ncbi:hypothetical protein, partial [Neisseria meningitidis]